MMMVVENILIAHSAIHQITDYYSYLLSETYEFRQSIVFIVARIYIATMYLCYRKWLVFICMNHSTEEKNNETLESFHFPYIDWIVFYIFDSYSHKNNNDNNKQILESTIFWMKLFILLLIIFYTHVEWMKKKYIMKIIKIGEYVESNQVTMESMEKIEHKPIYSAYKWIQSKFMAPPSLYKFWPLVNTIHTIFKIQFKNLSAFDLLSTNNNWIEQSNKLRDLINVLKQKKIVIHLKCVRSK